MRLVDQRLERPVIELGPLPEPVIRHRNEERAVMDDDFRELEPHISEHPFQPGTWPDACGHVDEHGWTCGYTRAEHTHISGEESTPP